MKIERLKKNHKKKIVIGTVAICIIGGALTFNLTRAKYKLTESISLVRGTLNYKVPDLRTVALYTNSNGTYQETNDIPTSGYGLNKEKSVCKVYDGTTSVENAPVDSSITIEYKSGKVNFLGISKRNTRCYLYFDKKDTDTVTVPFGEIEVKRTTPDFSQVATTDEGVYATYDNLYGGQTYYWRGAVTNNYVQFAGKCWRIIRINGDKSMRLIYDGTTCHANGTSTTESIAIKSVKYNSTYNQSNYVGWTYEGTSQRTLGGTSSNAKTRLESWYSSNLANYASKIADGKYCNDRNVGAAPSGWSGYVATWSATGASFAYAGVKRLYEDYQPTLSCASGDVYTLKVGLITIDEAMYAGGKVENNELYYLYNGQGYWAMSPGQWDSRTNEVYVCVVDSNGYLTRNYVGHTDTGLRPVINLKSDITFSGGNGEKDTPYIVAN